MTCIEQLQRIREHVSGEAAAALDTAIRALEAGESDCAPRERVNTHTTPTRPLEKRTAPVTDPPNWEE